METKNQRAENFSSIFLELGCGYFAIARYYASSFSNLISATMFHHAVEMLLKGYLVKNYSPNKLKNIGHNLIKLWDNYKSLSNNKDLSQLDETIFNLDKVELLRYPDKIVDEGFMIHVKLGKPMPVTTTNVNNPPEYFVNIDDIDKIINLILIDCKVAPKNIFRNTPAEFIKTLPENFKPY